LGHALEPLESQLIEDDRQNDGSGETEDYVEEANGKGIPDQPEKIRIIEKSAEVPEADPLAAAYAEIGPEILESDYKAVHGFIAK
jgi:hypothetical protein